MGQQQLLLLVLGAIIVSVAIIVGINMFNQNALTSAIDATKQDCLHIAARAQEWARKPPILGGPDTKNTFTGLDFMDIGYTDAAVTSYSNENADYSLDASDPVRLIISGETKETDGNAVTRIIYCEVEPFNLDTMYVQIGS